MRASVMFVSALIIAAAFFFAAEARATSDVLLLESFEGGEVPPEGWDSVVTVPSKTWELEDRVGYVVDGLYSARCEWQDTQLQDEWLISPDLDFSAWTAPVLSFYWYGSTYFAQFANLHVMVSDDGANYDDVWEIPFDDDGTGSHRWTYKEIELGAYGGSPAVNVAFRYYGQGGDTVIIDVVTVTGLSTAVAPASLGQVKANFR